MRELWIGDEMQRSDGEFDWPWGGKAILQVASKKAWG